MPTYEYRCPNGHDFERFSKISESQSTLPCPVCGAVAERRISGGAGLVFKGSGFYITDYGKDGKKDQKAPAAKSGDASPASGGGGESKSDAKTAGDAAAAKPAASAAPAPSKPSSSSSSSGGDA
ncbi:MAG TPA: zinc ribbon domain-containing protein [Gemmatimonadaceae bacterium]|nr:zinc ribbon domain-containing protein [Gemmatimonadaceae bacterium]